MASPREEKGKKTQKLLHAISCIQSTKRLWQQATWHVKICSYHVQDQLVLSRASGASTASGAYLHHLRRASSSTCFCVLLRASTCGVWTLSRALEIAKSHRFKRWVLGELLSTCLVRRLYDVFSSTSLVPGPEAEGGHLVVLVTHVEHPELVSPSLEVLGSVLGNFVEVMVVGTVLLVSSHTVEDVVNTSSTGAA